MNISSILDSGIRRPESPNYFNSICLYEAIIKLSGNSLCVFVHFNLLRYQPALVNKNVLSPHRFLQGFFMTGLNCPTHN